MDADVSVHGYVRTVKIMFTFMFTYRPKFYHADFKESLYWGMGMSTDTDPDPDADAGRRGYGH
jgi:hypothetical protein